MIKLCRLVFIAAAVLLSSGCASIVTGHNQPLTVETHHQGRMVDGAKCKLINEKGTWYVNTPGSVTVRRAYGDMQVICDKQKYPTANVNVRSKTKGMAAGNLVFGGGIGLGIDAATGAAFDYPEVIRVEMGAQGDSHAVPRKV